MADIFVVKNHPKYFCKLCDYKTSRKIDFDKHINTKKHKDLQNSDNDLQNCDNVVLAPSMVCFCGKVFKHRQSLHKHKKICNEKSVMTLGNEVDKNGVIKQLIIQNQQLIFENKEFKEFMIEQSKHMMEQNSKMMDLAVKPSTVNNIQSNTNTNCNNKQQFNLNVFLNEKCKDAMNMSDFIDSIKVNDEDFENIGKLGYVQGISNIFIKNLQKLDECVRPMHCSDAKREVIYIKENNEWKKDENQKAVRHVIAMIAHKNFKYMPFWTDANPGVFDGSTKKNDLFLKITNQITTAITPDDDVGICKIIRNVANRVVIDKSGGLS
jgi:hypothetical protein